MRDIKFRVWVEAPDEESAMHYPKLISFGSGQLSWATLSDDIVLKDNGWFTKREVMQYTGLKDKNGVEIYEGDIVRVTDEWGGDTRHEIKYCSEWDYPAFDLKPYLDVESNGLAYCMGSDSEIEVIGNIYENPDLLTPPKQQDKS